jgi:hypothetical protein
MPMKFQFRPFPYSLSLSTPVLCVVAALNAAGCGEAEEKPCAEPGATVPCSCAGGGSGAAICEAEGSLGPCDCESLPQDEGDAAEAPSDATGSDTELGPTEGFFGDRECTYTTATFAGEWSPADTSTHTLNVAPVEGGFSVSGYDDDTAFGLCEIVFDLDGAAATLRKPQPCTGAPISYDSGKVIVVGNDFSFDVLGTALGYTVSMKVDCGAGEVPPDPVPKPEGWLGDWRCTGTSTMQLTPDGMPVDFTLSVSQVAEGKLRTTFASDEIQISVLTLQSCDVLWNEESEVAASIAPDALCASGQDTVVKSEGGLTLDNGALEGALWLETSGVVNMDFAFSCVR